MSKGGFVQPLPGGVIHGPGSGFDYCPIRVRHIEHLEEGLDLVSINGAAPEYAIGQSYLRNHPEFWADQLDTINQDPSDA